MYPSTCLYNNISKFSSKNDYPKLTMKPRMGDCVRYANETGFYIGAHLHEWMVKCFQTDESTKGKGEIMIMPCKWITTLSNQQADG